MPRIKRTIGERGIATMELTLALPLIVLCILFLIGMGHALITKQHAMVAAQYAGNHHRIREAGPSAEQVGQSVSHGTEAFRLEGGGGETISYTASTTPQRGLLAQRYSLNDAVSEYHTVSKTGSCVPDCKPFDSFARLLSPETLTGLIFSFGGGGDIQGQGIIDAINGKKKNRQQAPQGEVANLNANGPTMAAAAPASAGGGGGKPPKNPPGGKPATGGADDGGGGNNGRGGKPLSPEERAKARAEAEELIGPDYKFKDPELEDRYQDYVERKKKKGEIPRERADWKVESDRAQNDGRGRGNRFNRTAGENYDYNEVNLEDGTRLDSYVPGKEIISRKAIDFDNIEERRFREHLDELKNKYREGKIIRSNKYPDIDGEPLSGKPILEVPKSNENAANRARFEELAREKGIEIRYTQE